MKPGALVLIGTRTILDGKDLQPGEPLTVTRSGVLLVGRFEAGVLRYIVPTEGTLTLEAGDLASRIREDVFVSIEKLKAAERAIASASDTAPALGVLADIAESVGAADLAPVVRALADFAERSEGGKRPTVH